VYGLARSMPGNPLTVQLGESDPSRKLNPEDQQRMLEIYGLDKPGPLGMCNGSVKSFKEILVDQ